MNRHHDTTRISVSAESLGKIISSTIPAFGTIAAAGMNFAQEAVHEHDTDDLDHAADLITEAMKHVARAINELEDTNTAISTLDVSVIRRAMVDGGLLEPEAASTLITTYQEHGSVVMFESINRMLLRAAADIKTLKDLAHTEEADLSSAFYIGYNYLQQGLALWSATAFISECKNREQGQPSFLTHNTRNSRAA